MQRTRCLRVMFFNLREMHGARERIDRRYPLSAFQVESGDEYVIVDTATLDLEILKDRDRYRLTGGLQTTVELVCSRCLESFRIPIDAPIDLRYLPRGENAGEGEREIEEEDLTTAYYRDEQIDLGQLVREQIWLAMPMKPLCREDCQGLCPVCGVNRNLGRCQCESEWGDPRLAGLKHLWSDKNRT